MAAHIHIEDECTLNREWSELPLCLRAECECHHIAPPRPLSHRHLITSQEVETTSRRLTASQSMCGENIGDRALRVCVLTQCGVFRVTASYLFPLPFCTHFRTVPGGRAFSLSLSFLIFCVVILLRCPFPVCDWSLFVMSFQCIF